MKLPSRAAHVLLGRLGRLAMKSKAVPPDLCGMEEKDLVVVEFSLAIGEQFSLR